MAARLRTDFVGTAAIAPFLNATLPEGGCESAHRFYLAVRFPIENGGSGDNTLKVCLRGARGVVCRLPGFLMHRCVGIF
jgi:hypothetical protein